MSNIDRRSKFLLEMYDEFWSNITRAEEAAWKMFAAYAALFVGISYAKSTIGVALFLTLIILFSFCAVALSLNANLWFVRNVNLISNLEKEFLDPADYGVLIPRRFLERYHFLSLETFEVWWVLVVLYLAIATVVPAVLYSQIEPCIGKLWVLETYLICLTLVIFYGALLRHRHRSFLEDAPGKTVTIASPRSS